MKECVGAGRSVMKCGGVWWNVVEPQSVCLNAVECGGAWWNVVECGGAK